MATSKSTVHGEIQPAQAIELDLFHENPTKQTPSLPHSSKDQVVQRQDEKQNVLEASTSPALAVPTKQKWNEPRGNIPRFIACFFTFFVVGLSDAAYGALLPYVSSASSVHPEDSANSSNSVRTILQPQLHRGVPGFSVSLRWLHNCSIHELMGPQ